MKKTQLAAMLTIASRLVAWIIACPFVRRQVPLRTTFEIIWWWEQRRLLYNAAVGLTGIGVGVVAVICGLFTERITGEAVGIPDPPFFVFIAIILYGIVANCVYTVGWIAELIYRKVGLQNPDQFAEFTFTGGVLFAIVLTAAPATVIVFFAALTILQHSPK